MSMKTVLIRFVIFPTLFDLSRPCPPHQKEALIRFKHLVERSSSMNSSSLGLGTWDVGSDCCKWDRVTCDSHHGLQQVSRLHLGYRKPILNLSISSDVLEPLFSVQSLVSLNVSYMGLRGEIPGPGFANFTKLIRLDMTGNDLIGSIPVEIGNLTRLQGLWLGKNSLSGSIQEWIANLKELQTLALYANSFSGEIPSELMNLQNISRLFLTNNNFVGRFPTWIRKMGKLQFFFMEGTSVSGEIPAWVFKMKTLKGLGLGGTYLHLTKSSIAPDCNLRMLSLTCNLSDIIPSWISNFTNLEILRLRKNSLEGVIPHWLAGLNLTALFLSYNKLSGSVPHHLFQSRTLQLLDLRGNNFSGRLPRRIVQGNMLIMLDLSDNSFSGQEFPAFDQDLPLQYADFSSNKFSGEVPYSLPKGLRILSWARNMFMGNLPQELGALSFLSHLDLHSNNIIGKIPNFLSQLTSLRFLNLRNNSFEGTFPCHLSRLHHLQILDLSINKLSARIPECIGNLSAMITKYDSDPHTSSFPIASDIFMAILLSSDMEVFWKSSQENIPGVNIMFYTMLALSHNQLTGEIPSTLARLHNLKSLNLSHNKLSGVILATLGDIKGLESLDLSHNQLSGHIPQTFSKLNELSTLDLSNNNFTGQIPAGPQMDRLNDLDSYVNNSGLCGPQIQVPCTENTERGKQGEGPKRGNPKENSRVGGETSISREMAGIGFAVGFVSMLLVTYSFGFFNAARTDKRCPVRRER